MVSQDNIINFVGREREIVLYEDWLRRSTGAWILYVHDAFSEDEKKGGIGKTWLLRKYVALTKERYPDVAVVTIDFFNVEDRDGLVIVSRIADALTGIHPQWSPEEYTKALAEYETAKRESAKREGAENTAFRSGLVDAFASDLARLKLLLKEEKRYLILFFDTFELIKDNPVIALLNPAQKFPHNYQFEQIGAVIAGRYEIDWANDPNWQGRENEVKEIPLGAFTPQDMIEYINKRCIERLDDGSKEAALLHERTHGRPILIGLVTDIVNNHVLTIADLLGEKNSKRFDEYLVSQINSLENSINWVILLMAHAYHRFNDSILQWMRQKSPLYGKISDIVYPTMLEKLVALSFVRRSTSGENFVLHDEMRLLVIRYCWEREDPYQEYRKEISKCIIEYYEKELTHEGRESTRSQSYGVAIVYHKLFLDLESGFTYFEQSFEEALKLWLHAYARSLWQEAQKFNASLPQGHQYTLVMLEALLLMREEKYDRALHTYQYLRDETEDNWFIKSRSAIHYGLAECYLYFDETSKALDNLEISQKLAEESEDKRHYADIMGMLGYIHQHHGLLDAAAHCYTQSMEIYKMLGDLREYSDAITSLGNIYHSQGKVEDALRCCKIALVLRKKLFSQGKLGEVPVGISLNMLAVIYLDMNDLIQATQYLEQAFEIFNRLGYRRGLARVYYRQGQIQIDDQPECAIELFRKAYDTAVSIGAKEEQINSLNGQGKVLLKQGQLEQAKERFEQAISLSEGAQDYYQQAESLLDLAAVFKYSRMLDRLEEVLKVCESITLEYHYYKISGFLEIFKGDMKYEEENYIEAFKNFVQACQYMMLFNSSFYNNAVLLVFDRLLTIPTPETIREIIAGIRDYWSAQKFTEKHPELIRVCDEAEILAL